MMLCDKDYSYSGMAPMLAPLWCSYSSLPIALDLILLPGMLCWRHVFPWDTIIIDDAHIQFGSAAVDFGIREYGKKTNIKNTFLYHNIS